ncbi:cytochrome P450 734A1-like [Vigna umbellata]|uniref:cytochrome P450 734A1-like n=1 Tax=Vigna umbellata TaxID=87088 RepID=UPI001F5F195C|nr:cytochrome P450 734A1-like [Vigna umbellata]
MSFTLVLKSQATNNQHNKADKKQTQPRPCSLCTTVSVCCVCCVCCVHTKEIQKPTKQHFPSSCLLSTTKTIPFIMDALFSSLSFLFLLFLLKLTVLLWWRPRKIQGHFSKQGIRGPPYRFFIGNVKELVAMMLKASSKPMPFSHNILPRVLSFYHHWKKIYGATFLVWFGPTVRLTVSDPDLIREIFTSKSEFYEKNEAPPLVKQLEGDGLLSLKGEKWAHHRRIISPTFHMENLKLLIPVMATSVVEMLEKWSAMGEKGEVEIEVSEWFQRLTEDVITRTAFGSSYEDGKAIFRLQGQQMDLAADAFQKVFIPGYRFVPTRRNIKSWKLEKEIKKSLVKLIERRRENSEKVVEKGAKDLLGLMIEASNTNSTNVTVDDIVEECKSFFFAGKQTTSNLLTWTTILLAMHPQWQVRAREEVLKMCGSRDLPTKDHVAKLRTVSMIVNESLRLYPPTIATIRRAKTDVELGGYKIPRGTELLVPILAVHHDQAIWGNDANEFNPGRFSQGVARAANHPLAFIPFGVGVRTCIGQNLAVLQTKLALAIILQRFSFRLAPSYQHAPTVLMLLYPQYGAPIIFQRFSTPPPPQPSSSSPPPPTLLNATV